MIVGAFDLAEGQFWMRFLAPVVSRFALAAAVALGAAETASAASGRISIESGGVKRTAFLVEHARLKQARRPVIVFLHGQSGAGVRVRNRLGLDRALKSRSVVAVYPDAIGERWDLSEAGSDRELKFVRDLIATGPREPRRGAPYTFVTTEIFLAAFGLESLRELPDPEQLADAGLAGPSEPPWHLRGK